MVKVGEQGIFLSDDTAKKISPYILSQLKKTLVLNLNSVQSFSETDPIFSLWQSTYDNHADWDTAYGWGNHASVGYLTGITSGDVTTALGYTPVTNARTLTINGTTYDLTADRSWTISGSGVSALSAIGSTPNANSATITGSTLNLEPASVSFGGVVSACCFFLTKNQVVNDDPNNIKISFKFVSMKVVSIIV